ncbi:hypothetical protein KPSA3_04541 [Pseudomonas syringae pv. actinidiae]|uniref:Uncharacterized protein n=1 Tax=Pseudomonas syringae pv. actinidiae TaxID=103796 RepID=A0AAN4Q723_PSESF|nr:hypothetical protein KPSA3_04541 [Pseudomonas syringae pv. actinidiae]
MISLAFSRVEPRRSLLLQAFESLVLPRQKKMIILLRCSFLRPVSAVLRSM